MTELVDTGSARTCAFASTIAHRLEFAFGADLTLPSGAWTWTDVTPMFEGFICERDAGHYPATPHAAFIGPPELRDRPPVYWTDEGRETDALGRTIKSKPPQFVRADVEAKQQANDAILKQLAQRSVGVATGDLLMTYVALIVERLFGDMDDQRRLELENAYADLARIRLESTMTAVDRALLTRDITPSGLHLPDGGQ